MMMVGGVPNINQKEFHDGLSMFTSFSEELANSADF